MYVYITLNIKHNAQFPVDTKLQVSTVLEVLAYWALTLDSDRGRNMNIILFRNEQNLYSWGNDILVYI